MCSIQNKATKGTVPHISLFATMDPTATWTVEWYRLVDVDVIIPHVRLYEQSIIPLFQPSPVIEFWKPKVCVRSIVVAILQRTL